MTRRNIAVVTVILVIFCLALWVLLPVDSVRLGREGMHLGLDLVGGVHLVYRADFPDDATTQDKAQDIERALDTIRRRIDALGVAEPVIQQQENERILIQLPGFTDIEAAKALVQRTGFLEFRKVELDGKGNPVYLDDYLDAETPGFFNASETEPRIFALPATPDQPQRPPFVFLSQDERGAPVYRDGAGEVLTVEEIEGKIEELQALTPGSARMLAWIPARASGDEQLTGGYLATAQPLVPQSGLGLEAVVALEWDGTGALMFDEIAAELYSAGPEGTEQRLLGIFLDDTLVSSPQILEPQYGGTGQITGQFTVEEAQELATLLQSGSLPMPLDKQPLYEDKVSATLGADFIEMSLLAGLIGIVLVMLFMILYYRLAGLLASLALVFYGAVVLAIFKLVPVTLTLAGIGGFVLSIGMAVDANVLIFERMREELRTGRTVGAAIEAGFNRAWTAIRDSNITTFIVCAILYWLGSSIVASAPVMGFALTLFIGVAVSMFTAIVITRTLLRVTLHTPMARRRRLFIRETRKD